MNVTRELAVTSAQAYPQPQNTSVGLVDLQSFELAQRVAKLFAASDLVPARFKDNIPNCVIALNMAARIGADPLMVAQNLYVVHGTPAWSAQFLIAAFNSTPGFSKLRYEFKGQEGTDEWSCRAWAIEKATEARLDGAWVSIGIAKEEGWSTKNGSKWKTMPQQMLMYRAAAWFVRAYAPEIAMGLQTNDEVADTYDLEPDGQGSYAAKPALSASADLNSKVFDQQPEQPEAGPSSDQQTEKPKRATKQQAAQESKPAKDPEPTQASADTVACPNRLHHDTSEMMQVLTKVCADCKDRPSCPSWETGEVPA